MQSRLLLALLSAALLCSCEPPVVISGHATVTDGDSLEIGATRIRLHAIDAPEGRQPCYRNGVPWRCGAAAAAKLETLVATREIACTKTDTDSYGRTVAVCRDGRTDLNALMVSSGFALAYREFGDDYVDEEEHARAAELGVWAAEFTPPWEWRRNSQADEQAEPSDPHPRREPGSCSIKGNINRQGERIYHAPGSSSYEQTRIDESRGERWFCSEEEARNAGWRAPRGR